jgi:hypothetical protein
LPLLIRTHNRARCQAEILLSALCKKAEPPLYASSVNNKIGYFYFNDEPGEAAGK